MSYNADLLGGYAQLLDDNGIAVYLTSGAYSPAAVAVFIGITPDKPDRSVTLMTYPVDANDLGNTTTGLQVKTRGLRNPNEVTELADSIYDLLHNKQHYAVGGVHVELSWHQSGAWMGQDDQQRIERVDNFYLRAERVAPNNAL